MDVPLFILFAAITFGSVPVLIVLIFVALVSPPEKRGKRVAIGTAVAVLYVAANYIAYIGPSAFFFEILYGIQ